jgi:hypothetical protein
MQGFCLRDANRKSQITLHKHEVRKPQTRMTVPRAATDSEVAMDALTKTSSPFREGILVRGHEALFSAPCRKPTSRSRHIGSTGSITFGPASPVIRHFMFRSHSVTNKSRSGHVSSHDITADHISWQRLVRVDLGSHYKLNPDDNETQCMNSCLNPFHHIYRPLKS